jgi:hypothetical protein
VTFTCIVCGKTVDEEDWDEPWMYRDHPNGERQITCSTKCRQRVGSGTLSFREVPD